MKVKSVVTIVQGFGFSEVVQVALSLVSSTPPLSRREKDRGFQSSASI